MTDDDDDARTTRALEWLFWTNAITLQKIIMALAGPEPRAALDALAIEDPIRTQLIVWPVAYRLAARIQPLPEGVEYDVIRLVQEPPATNDVDLPAEDPCSRIL